MLHVTPSVHCIPQPSWHRKAGQMLASTLKGPAGAVQEEEPVLGVGAVGAGSNSAVNSLRGFASSGPQSSDFK